MSTFDIAPHKCKANSEVRTMRVGRTLTGVFRHMWGIFSSIEIEGTIQYNQFCQQYCYRCNEGAELRLSESNVCVCNLVSAFPRLN